MNHSINAHLVLHRTIRIVMICALLIVAAWLLSPASLTDDSFDLQRVIDSELAEVDDVESTEVALNKSVFDRQLWHTPPQLPEPQPRASEPQPTQTSYMLIAITAATLESGELSRTAVIYDPEMDLVYQVQVGEQAGQFRVQSISNQEVVMEQGQRVAKLTLDLMEAAP